MGPIRALQGILKYHTGMEYEPKTRQATITPEIEEREINPSGDLCGDLYFPVPGTAQAKAQSTSSQGPAQGDRMGEREGGECRGPGLESTAAMSDLT